MTPAGLRSLRDVQRAYVNAVKDFLDPNEATREASLVIADLTGLDRMQQSIRGGDAFEGDLGRFDAIVTARQQRQPLAQILGYAPFRDRMFRVTSDVLCPRADTETLLDAALATTPCRILDLGTGPGTLALTLLAELPDARAVASDISAAALAVAATNADALQVADRVTFTQSDWLEGIDGTFDLIVSNPPYVDARTYAALAPEITLWEPEIALTPGGDGLEAYRILTRDAPQHLSPNGHLMVEIGYDQGPPVAQLFRDANLQDVTILTDLGGKDRAISGKMP